jgi:hypothetical protein
MGPTRLHTTYYPRVHAPIAQDRWMEPSRSPQMEEGSYPEPTRDVGISESVRSGAMGGTDPMGH